MSIKPPIKILYVLPMPLVFPVGLWIVSFVPMFHCRQTQKLGLFGLLRAPPPVEKTSKATNKRKKSRPRSRPYAGVILNCKAHEGESVVEDAALAWPQEPRLVRQARPGQRAPEGAAAEHGGYCGTPRACAPTRGALHDELSEGPGRKTSRRRTVCCIQDGTMDDRKRLGDLLDRLFRITARRDRFAL